MASEDQSSQACARKPSSTAIATALLTVATAFALDRLSKSWALSHLQLHQSQPFIDGFLRLTLTTNTGAAFSLGANNGSFMTITAVVLTLALLCWLGSRIVRGQSVPIIELIGLCCIIGGSLGNLADRFAQGHVTDFLEFAFFSFPVFNVADTFINIGLGLVLIARIGKSDAGEDKDDRQEKEAAPAQPEKSQ